MEENEAYGQVSHGVTIKTQKNEAYGTLAIYSSAETPCQLTDCMDP